MLKKIAKRILAAAVAFSMVLSAVPSSAVNAADSAEKYVDIDDSVTTASGEKFKIQYESEGRWFAEAGYPNLFFDGTDHYSSTGSAEDYYTMTFTGTGVAIYGSKNVAHADAEVYIDGENVGEVLSHQESGETQHKQLLFELHDLENEEHVLKVVRKSGDTRAMQVDKIRVYYEELSPTAISLSPQTVRMGLGETKQILVSAEPWVIDTPEVQWSSEDEKVVTVTEDGLITASSSLETVAETTVTATVKGTDVTASVQVVVDSALQQAAVSVGNEKLLDTQQDYEELLNAEVKDSWSGTAWKGDELNSKIQVLSKAEGLHNVTVTASDFTGKNGAVLSNENISIKWLKEIDANDGRNMGGVVNAYPDVIYKGGAIDLDAETVRFAWVNMEIPEDTKAGTYTGTISVSADELRFPVELTYTIEVLNLVQPEPEATEIQIWQHPFSVANYYLGLGETPTWGISYEVNNDFYFTEEHFNLMRATMEEYASMGGHDLVANIVEEAWNHQSYYGDPSMVKWTKNADDTWTFDYTWYDAWVEFAEECGVIAPEEGIGQIKCYSIVPWNNQIAYYDAVTGQTVKESHAPGTEAWTEMWTAFLEDFIAHSEEKGWFDITYISMDERSLDQLRPAVALIEEVTNDEGEHLKISSALNYAAPEYYDFTDRIDDISINLGNCSNRDQMNALSEHRRELGLNTTFYSCTGDYPSNYIISDPGDNYWTIWYSMTLGTDGFMRWAWDNYVYDMHGDVSYRYWEPGDGWFIYPVERTEIDEDYNAGFYSTPRYEMFKQGIRDVAKAKYLMQQSDELNAQISELVAGMQCPKKTTYHGSAVAANEAQRMLVHSETDRVYAAVTEIAREYAPALEEEAEVARISGKDRYETAMKAADAFKEELGVEKFETVIVASGKKFADALAGSYLSTKKNAPILMTSDSSTVKVQEYIRENLAADGTVYILGGTAAVSETFEKGLAGLNVKRLQGKKRYETNLLILEEAQVTNEEILICTGKKFADSLSASATGKAILLVGADLSEQQKAFLEAHKENKIYILGGTGAVNETVEASVTKICGKAERVKGADRYETSVKIAEMFFEQPESAVIAYGKNYPDGLAGGALAYSKNAPLILANSESFSGYEAASDYTESHAIRSGLVLGGEKLISDEAVREIFSMDTESEILTK